MSGAAIACTARPAIGSAVIVAVGLRGPFVLQAVMALAALWLVLAKALPTASLHEARARAEAELALWSFGRPGVVDVRIVPQVPPDPESGAVTEEMLASHRQEPLRDGGEKPIPEG